MKTFKIVINLGDIRCVYCSHTEGAKIEQIREELIEDLMECFDFEDDDLGRRPMELRQYFKEFLDIIETSTEEKL